MIIGFDDVIFQTSAEIILPDKMPVTPGIVHVSRIPVNLQFFHTMLTAYQAELKVSRPLPEYSVKSHIYSVIRLLRIAYGSRDFK